MWPGWGQDVARVLPGCDQAAVVANMDATEIANAKNLACYVLSCALDVVG